MIKYLLFAAFALALQSHSAPLQINRMVPRAIHPGTNTVVTFSGTGLGEVKQLWSTAEITSRFLTNNGDHEVSFEISASTNACGIAALQLAGQKGASDYELFLFDPLPNHVASEPRYSPTSAMSLQTPCAVDAEAKKERVDYYNVHGEAGQVFSIEILAHRIGSNMDSIVQVLDAQGEEMAFADDEGGTSRDSRFQWKCPRTGEYLVAVHDVGYGGGEDFFYRLRIGDFPLLWYTYPLQPMPGERTEYYGMGIRSTREGLCFASGHPTFENALEQEPNNNPAQAQTFQLPKQLNGKFQYSGDVDCFSFEGLKNQKISFIAKTRSLGSPCDLLLQVKKPEGTSIGNSDPVAASEGKVNVTLPESGRYILQVREISGNAGVNLPYAIIAAQSHLNVELATDKNILELQPGKETTLKVEAVRSDYDGALQFKIEPPVKGLELITSELPEKKNDCELKFRAGSDLAPGTLLHFQIRAEMRETSKTQFPVSTGPALKKSFPLILYPPAFLDGTFTCVVTRD
jgi:hypothetical protein